MIEAGKDICGSSPAGVPVPEPSDSGAWPGVPWRDWLPVLLLLGTVAGLIFPCLSPGICRGDFGDLQLAGATLGIAHPPGYSIYTTVLYLCTWFPFVDPMFAISVACLVSGLVALGLVILFQIRLGISAWIAAAAVAILVPTTRFRLNLIAPEVYMPTLAFLAGAAYLTLRFSRTSRTRDIVAAACFFGVACVSRPPIVLAAPFFILAWWVCERSRHAPVVQRLRRLGWITAAAVSPAVYSAGYVMVRDQPTTKYNYIDHYNLDEQTLPQVDEGLAARLQRIWWLMSGQQFTEYVRVQPNRVYRKLRWLRNEVAPLGNAMLAVWLVPAAWGAWLTLRRSPPGALVLSGLIVQSFLFVCIYDVHGQAADIMPLLVAGVIFIGMAAGRLIGQTPRGGRYFAGIVFALSVGWAVAESLPPRLCRPAFVDGSGIAEQANLETLPAGAVLMCIWDDSVLFRYAQIFLTNRPDITIITASLNHWRHLAHRFRDRPLFLTDRDNSLTDEYELSQIGVLWHAVPR